MRINSGVDGAKNLVNSGNSRIDRAYLRTSGTTWPTSGTAMAEGPRDALVSRNSATY